MNLFFAQISTFLTNPPGNLVYHLILAFSVAGSLLLSVTHWQKNKHSPAKRVMLGMGVLLSMQLILFIISFLSWENLLDPRHFLPPLDRAITLLSLITIGWLWAFPESSRSGDSAAIVLVMLTLSMTGLTLVFWNPGITQQAFNGTSLEFIWQMASLFLLLLSAVILGIRQPSGWGNGLAMMILAALGHSLSLLITLPADDYPGLVRLTHCAMYPMLLALPLRFPFPPDRIITPVESTLVKDEQPLEERRKLSTDPKTFHALLLLAAEPKAEKIAFALTRSVAQTMLADLCFLIQLADDKNLYITCGYDLIREENLEGCALDRDALPHLVSAIQRGRALRLSADSSSVELEGLGELLGLSNPGHLLSVPIGSSKGSQLGALLLLSPYSDRMWNEEDQTFLSNVSSLFDPILERAQHFSSIGSQLTQAQEQVKEVEKKYNQILKQLEASRKETESSQDQAGEISALKATQEELQQRINQLQTENKSLRKTSVVNATDSGSDQLEGELRMTLEEMAHLQNSLAEANHKILELEKQPHSPLTSEQVEVIGSISQELRQPMSSIIGYTDLLLGESVGILGALQRKFLERIKVSTERIGGLVEDLIQITTLEMGHVEYKPEPIDLNQIFDNAVSYTSTQLREKNITLRLDIPESPPQIQTDREALQQTLIHLLQNAGAATLVEGTIILRARFQKENEQDYLLIQVTDTGGGIPAEDLPSVFERRFRADNVLIQGLGDTGVGLSIAKNLVEAQKGKIWVETEMGTGSTFSALLPATPQKPGSRG